MRARDRESDGSDTQRGQIRSKSSLQDKAAQKLAALKKKYSPGKGGDQQPSSASFALTARKTSIPIAQPRKKSAALTSRKLVAEPQAQKPLNPTKRIKLDLTSQDDNAFQRRLEEEYSQQHGESLEHEFNHFAQQENLAIGRAGGEPGSRPFTSRYAEGNPT